MSLNRVKVREPLNMNGSIATPLMEAYSFSTKPNASIISNPRTDPAEELMGGQASVLDGTNPRIEGSLDITGAVRPVAVVLSLSPV